ncbi:MAG: hypothetical protein NDJ94_06900 [Vicinamibacteria bacterium]|nr:hypothetical protein [Vicinamibacteria bacterium]
MSATAETLLDRARRLAPGVATARTFFDEATDLVALATVLRHPLPAPLLETAAQHACARDARVAGALVRNPRTPRAAALRLMPVLRYLDLAHAAGDVRLAAAVRQRADGALLERLRQLAAGELLAIARLATGRVLESLLAHADVRIVDAALESRHLHASRLAVLLTAPEASPRLAERAAECWRFREDYTIRRALALAPRCPLPVALAQLSRLTRLDLREVAAHPGLHRLVRVAAGRLATGS